MMLEDQA